MIRLINALLAIVGGVGAALLLYWVLNKLVETFPGKWEERLKPWVFIGPAVAPSACSWSTRPSERSS